jgi:hypothetical protein
LDDAKKDDIRSDPFYNLLELTSKRTFGNIVERTNDVTKFQFEMENKNNKSSEVGFPVAFEISDTVISINSNFPLTSIVIPQINIT